MWALTLTLNSMTGHAVADFIFTRELLIFFEMSDN